MQEGVGKRDMEETRTTELRYPGTFYDRRQAPMVDVYPMMITVLVIRYFVVLTVSMPWGDLQHLE